MTDELVALQFIHPGPEHDELTGLSWSIERAHRRRFMQVQGRYVDPPGTVQSGEIRFWGEWEPGADLIERLPGGDGLPRYVFRPVLPQRPAGWAQNTDPLVFDGFRYGICLQGPRGRLVRRLLRGSVILFGSPKMYGGKSTFMLDTVFVVARSTLHSASRLKTLAVDELYRDISLRMHYSVPGERERSERLPLRLYWGATVDDPIEGMFSFFPCRRADDADPNFARPLLAIDGARGRPELGWISPTKPQNYTRHALSTLDDAHAIWSAVRDEVVGAGCVLGVMAAAPARQPD